MLRNIIAVCIILCTLGESYGAKQGVVPRPWLHKREAEGTVGESRFRVLTGTMQRSPSSTIYENERAENEINCAYAGWYMTEDGRLYRCQERTDSDSSVYPIPISVNPEIPGPAAQVYTPGLSGLSPVDETKFGLSQDLAELYGAPNYDPIHFLKPVAHKPVETVVKPVEHVKPVDHVKPIVHLKPILKPVEYIKPIELKPIIYKPIIKPIEKPLVLKPIVYKPIITPIHKPLEIKPIVHKPLAIKPHHKPIHHHHGHKPCHHIKEKPHVLLNSAHLVPHSGTDAHLVGANSLEQTGFSGLHPTGHGAVNHYIKNNDREDAGTLNPLHAWAPPFIPSLYPSLSYDRPYYLVPNIQTYDQGLETDERVQTILPVKKIEDDSVIQPSDKTEEAVPAQSAIGKTIPVIRNVIENIQQNIEQIPSILGIQGHETATNGKQPNSPIPSKDPAESGNAPSVQEATDDAKLAAAVEEVAKSDANEASEANESAKSVKEIPDHTPVRRLDVPEDEIEPEAVSQVVQLVSDISSSGPENGRTTDAVEEPVEASLPETGIVADENSTGAETVRDQDEVNEAPSGNDYIPEDQGDEQQARKKRHAPAIPIEILQDKETSDTILDKTALLEIMTALKEEYLKNAEPDQRKLIEDAFDRLHCSVRDMKQPEERPIGKKVHSPERATLELLAEHVQPMVDYADYYNDATEEISAEPTFLELLNVAEQHKSKSEDQ